MNNDELAHAAENKLANEAAALGLRPQDPTNDDFDSEGTNFDAGARINVPLDSIFGENQDMGMVEASLRGEEGALLLPSDHHPHNLPPRWDGNPATEMRENHVRFAAQAAATMKSPAARTRLDPMSQAHLQEILKQSESLPNPDVTTYVGNRRVVIAGDVTSTPNKLDKGKSLEQLRLFLQQEGVCTRDKRGKDGSIEWCVCPTHRVARCAQQNGFRDKPLLWLAQKIAELVAARDVWKELPEDGSYNMAIDEDMISARSLPKALAQLISISNVENIITAMRGRCSLVVAFRYFTLKACDAADAIKTPKEYTHQFDV
jgi:hypothetical protein